MITIKKLLFELLDEMEPNEILQLQVSHNYHNIFVANTKSILPLATEIRRGRTDDEESLLFAYRAAFAQGAVDEYEAKYIEEHTIQLDNKEYIIIEELIDIQYKEDYFCVTVSNPEGIYTEYIKYDDIKAIKQINVSGVNTVRRYNALNYEFKTNK